MGRRKKNAPVRKQDTFMSICKISGWLLFFIIYVYSSIKGFS